MPVGGFGKLGFGREEGVFTSRGDGLDTGREPASKRLLVESERDAQQGRQAGDVVAVDAEGGKLVELVQQRPRLLAPALGE